MADAIVEIYPMAEWSAIAQVVIASAAVIGLLVSLYYSRRALREVNLDRLHRQRPCVAFQQGGLKVFVEFVRAGKTVPGIEPDVVGRLFPNLPSDAESIRLRPPVDPGKSKAVGCYGFLANFGVGPALHVSVEWTPRSITIGSDRFMIDDSKLREAPYRREVNTIPAGHILPGAEAYFFRLPTFIEKDVEKKISEAAGMLTIRCTDVYGQPHISRQKFHISTFYSDSPPFIILTFGDLLQPHKDGGIAGEREI